MKFLRTAQQRTIWRLVPKLGGKSLADLTPSELVLVTKTASQWIKHREADVARLRSSPASKYYTPEELDQVEAKIAPFTNKVRALLADITARAAKP